LVASAADLGLAAVLGADPTALSSHNDLKELAEMQTAAGNGVLDISAGNGDTGMGVGLYILGLLAILVVIGLSAHMD
jgi:hypothetical protein